MERSHRDLLNDVDKHRYFLKNNQTPNYPCFIFTPKTGNHSLKQEFCLYCKYIVFYGQVMTFLFLSRHLEEALKDSTLTATTKVIYLAGVLEEPAKFNVSFEFLKENVDEILNV